MIKLSLLFMIHDDDNNDDGGVGDNVDCVSARVDLFSFGAMFSHF